MFGYWKGRNAPVVSRQSVVWTNIPLIALAIISIGPSLYALILYLTYRFGLVQPHAPEYGFHAMIFSYYPVLFALINWAFVPLYVVCRIWPNLGAARRAMWSSVIAMSVPNLALFVVAPEMVSNAVGAGQGIGMVIALLTWSPIWMIWPDIFVSIASNASIDLFVIASLTGFLPLLGLIAWSVVALIFSNRCLRCC